MKNFGIIALILLLFGVAAFVMWKMMQEKKTELVKTEKAAVQANTDAMLAVQEVMTGMDLSDSVRVSRKQFGVS